LDSYPTGTKQKFPARPAAQDAGWDPPKNGRNIGEFGSFRTEVTLVPGPGCRDAWNESAEN